MLPLLIRADFVLATLLLVAAPLGLLAGAWHRPQVRGALLAYWRASSLLMITVYLLIDGRTVAFVTGNAALVLIPLSLYYGDVLWSTPDRPVDDGSVERWFQRWRRGATLFCCVNLLLTVPSLRCMGDRGSESQMCGAWQAPPRELHAALHPSVDPALLGDVAVGGLVVYGGYLTASVVRGLRADRTG